jgi:predicted DNA-binding transcriptional regulator AlpA
METRGLMDIDEVAAFLSVSPGTLYHWLSERRGPPCVRLSSGCLRWRMSDIDAWVSERVEKPGQEQRRRRRKAAPTMKGSEEKRAAVQVDNLGEGKNDLPLLREPNQSEYAAEEAKITGGARDDVIVLVTPEEE